MESLALADNPLDCLSESASMLSAILTATETWIVMKKESPEDAHLRHIRELDPDLDPTSIGLFPPCLWKRVAGGFSRKVTLVTCVSSGYRPNSIVPQLGDNLRIYGHRHLRGIDINSDNIFYCSPAAVGFRDRWRDRRTIGVVPQSCLVRGSAHSTTRYPRFETLWVGMAAC